VGTLGARGSHGRNTEKPLTMNLLELLGELLAVILIFATGFLLLAL
jgi:hypothetical protein